MNMSSDGTSGHQALSLLDFNITRLLSGRNMYIFHIDVTQMGNFMVKPLTYLSPS
jgi:hypothetical protein